jgi:hypothetical protein
MSKRTDFANQIFRHNNFYFCSKVKLVTVFLISYTARDSWRSLCKGLLSELSVRSETGAEKRRDFEKVKVESVVDFQ